MKHTIKVPLSYNGIKKAIKEIEKYRDEFDVKVQLFVSRLAELGYKIVVLNTDDAEWTGSLKAARGFDVEMTKTGYKGKVYVKDDAAVFVEFGYGIKGSSTPYIGDKSKMSSIGYSPMNPSLDATLYNNNIGLFLSDDDKGNVVGQDPATGKNIVTTGGQVSRAFMFKAAQEMKRQIEFIAKEVFGQASVDTDIPF